MLLLIDNYDSFVHNLARYFRRLGQETMVVRNDALSLDDIAQLRPDAIVLSPGPCTPNEAGISLKVVQNLAPDVPILGVCLGHQAIGAACGAAIVRAREPMHGRTSEVFHQNGGIFAGLPSPFLACRYHSLVVDRETLPACFIIDAWTADGTVMALRHRERPLLGLQFHPESILTNIGYPLLAAFLRWAKLPVAASIPSIEHELAEPIIASSPLPSVPVTF